VPTDRAITWQPIDTAPKGMNAVLLYWPYWTKEPIIGERDYRCADDGQITWFDSWHTERWLGDDATDPGPTHWMPLPAPPAPGESKSKPRLEVAEAALRASQSPTEPQA